MFNTPSGSFANARTRAVYELTADCVHDLEEEQRRLDNERLRAMIE